MRKMVFFFAMICCTITGHAQGITLLKMTDLVKLFNNKSDTIYVVNFWASFCKPCVAEIPDFITITDKYKNQKVKLLLVSVDLPAYYPAKIAVFAKQHHFNTHIAWLKETNADYFCPMNDSSWSGTIPATIIVNAKTGYKKFWEGDVKGDLFEKELKQAIGEKSKSMANKKIKSPMNNATILDNSDLKGETQMMIEGVIVNSNDSAVYSVKKGVVEQIVLIDSFRLVIIKLDSTMYCYSNLDSVFVKQGETVKEDQLIGYAAFDTDRGFKSIDFIIAEKKGKTRLTKNDFVVRTEQNSKDHSFDPEKEPE